MNRCDMEFGNLYRFIKIKGNVALLDMLTNIEIELNAAHKKIIKQKSLRKGEGWEVK
jgi:hypothetical protein